MCMERAWKFGYSDHILFTFYKWSYIYTLKIFIAAVHHRSNKKRVNKVVFLHYPDFLHCSLCIGLSFLLVIVNFLLCGVSQILRKVVFQKEVNEKKPMKCWTCTCWTSTCILFWSHVSQHSKILTLLMAFWSCVHSYICAQRNDIPLPGGERRAVVWSTRIGWDNDLILCKLIIPGGRGDEWIWRALRGGD
jgi:hypothetical protein